MRFVLFLSTLKIRLFLIQCDTVLLLFNNALFLLFLLLNNEGFCILLLSLFIDHIKGFLAALSHICLMIDSFPCISFNVILFIKAYKLVVARLIATYRSVINLNVRGEQQFIFCIYVLCCRVHTEVIECTVSSLITYFFIDIRLIISNVFLLIIFTVFKHLFQDELPLGILLLLF